MRDSESGIRRLFEAILKQEVYDERACRENSGRSWNNNQWSVAKNYLHQSIMGTLMHRRQNELSAWNVRSHLQYLEILYGKELYRQCWKKLRQIERIAEKLDDPVLRNELLQWKYRLHSRNYHQVSMEEFDSLHATFLANKGALEEYLRVQYLYQRFFFALRNKGLIQKRENLLHAFEEILSDPLFSEDSPPCSMAAALLVDHALGTWTYIRGDYKGAFERFRRVIGAMEENKGWVFSHPGLYFASLYWYGLCSFETLDFEEVQRVLSKMDRLKGDSAHNKARLFYYKAQLHRSHVSIFGDAAENLQFARQAIRELDTHKARCRPAEVMNFTFNMGLSFVIANSFEEARRCFTQILQFPVLREVPEYELTTKMLLTILSMENGDQGLYRHYRRSLRRLVVKEADAYPLENFVLDGLAELAQSRGEEARKEAARRMVPRIKELEARAANRYFDFDAWFRSVGGEKSFREIYQEKAKAGII